MKKKSWLGSLHQGIDKQKWLQSLILLGIRCYLLPVFLFPGWQQFNNFEETVVYFGDIMHLPYPYYVVIAIIGIQLLGSISLGLGFLTRWSAFLLVIVVLITVFMLQIDQGWYYIVEYNSVIDQIINLVQQHGNYDQITQQGDIVLLNNGVEISVAYLLMLLVLFVFGGGKLSMDSRLWDK